MRIAQPAFVASAIASILWSAPGFSQDGGLPAPTLPDATVKVEDLPPPLRLGIRAELLARKLPTISAVVLVPDAAAYIDAIAHWSLSARFPVLIDDGSPQVTEDIARFVRAFAPAHVYRWPGEGGSALPAEIKDRVERAIANAWGVPPNAPDPPAATQARWSELSILPPGIIVADTGDHAWTAALALAAGRAEPIVWLDAPAGINRVMKPADADTLAAAIDEGCVQSGYSWAGMGDDLDAITLCLNLPVKIELGEKDWIATTDRIGRGIGGGRWAWAGQVIGEEARAAYSAMCALFLHPSSAWLFEGYPGGSPWSEFSQAQAGAVLKEAGLEPTVLGGAGPGDRAWRAAASRPLDAGLICVNSKGNRDFFDLGSARCKPGDIPFLARPAIVYFVHSWSANLPGSRLTVAGRWLERGAYAYLGSVQEPMLQAFVPTPKLAARLGAGAAWGAAVRLDNSRVWKVAAFGDPLITLGTALGPWPDRVDSPLPLQGASDLHAGLKPLLTEKKYAQAARTLVLLGRDDDAARLAIGVITDELDRFDSALAEMSIMPLFRTGRTDFLLRAFVGLDEKGRATGAYRDTIWNAFGAGLATTKDVAVVTVLAENLRDDQISRDALDLADAIDRTRGPGAGGAFLSAARERITNTREQAAFDKAVRSQVDAVVCHRPLL